MEKKTEVYREYIFRLGIKMYLGVGFNSPK